MNVKLDEATREDFSAYCKKTGQTQRDALRTMLRIGNEALGRSGTRADFLVAPLVERATETLTFFTEGLASLAKQIQLADKERAEDREKELAGHREKLEKLEDEMERLRSEAEKGCAELAEAKKSVKELQAKARQAEGIAETIELLKAANRSQAKKADEDAARIAELESISKERDSLAKELAMNAAEIEKLKSEHSHALASRESELRLEALKEKMSLISKHSDEMSTIQRQGAEAVQRLQSERIEMLQAQAASAKASPHPPNGGAGA
jgi:hypothetical protein